MNRFYLNSDNAIFHLERDSFRELRKTPQYDAIRNFAVLDSQDFLVSFSSGALLDYVGPKIDTLGFNPYLILSNIFGGKYLVTGPKAVPPLMEKALLIDEKHPKGQSLELILEPSSESELKTLLVTGTVGGRNVAATYFAGKEFRAIFRLSIPERRVPIL